MENNEKTAPIGIIGAMESEVELLREAMRVEKTETVSGIDFLLGTLGGHAVVLARCGIGKVNAAVCAQTMILGFGAGCVVNTGVAGSLDDEINIGDLVISTDAVQHDMDVTSLGYGKGVIPGLETSVFGADPAMRRYAAQSAAAAAPEIRVFEGRVCSGDQFIASAEKKQALIEDFGGLCCEMEGAAIAQVCAMNRTPFVILRAISDKADDYVDFRTFARDAARRSAAIVRHMVESL